MRTRRFANAERIRAKERRLLEVLRRQQAALTLSAMPSGVLGSLSFAAIGEHDYSLSEESPARGAGLGGENLGASEVALKLAKLWLSRDTSGYAQAEWDE